MSGRTEDGILVIKGCFPFVNSIGVPLSDVVSFLHNKGGMVDWIDFYIQSVRHGWPPEHTFERLRQVVGEEYGRKFRESWEVKMREVMRLCEEHGIGTGP